MRELSTAEVSASSELIRIPMVRIICFKWVVAKSHRNPRLFKKRISFSIKVQVGIELLVALPLFPRMAVLLVSSF